MFLDACLVNESVTLLTGKKMFNENELNALDYNITQQCVQPHNIKIKYIAYYIKILYKFILYPGNE